MPDGAIVIPDTAAAPKDYTLSGAQEIALKSVRALIDGTGAGSAFLPTLQLLDPNGHVMWEGAAQSTVAAGGSADVSWFPVGAQLGGATSSGAVISGKASRGAALTFAAGIHTLTFDTFVSNDPSITKGAGALFSTVNLAGGGQIRIDVSMSWASNTGAAYVGQFQLFANGAGGFGTVNGLTGPPVDITQVYSTGVGDSFNSNGTSTWNANPSFSAPPYAFNLTLENDQSIFTNSYSMIVQIENPTPLT
jgi:hypothetical protein